MYIVIVQNWSISLKFLNYKKSVVRFADYCPQQLKIVVMIKMIKSNSILNLI